MTSQLNVDTIVDKAGSGGTNVKVGNTSTYVSDGGGATPNLVNSVVKAWGFGDGGANLGDSLNIASGTDNGVGQYTYAYTTNFNTNKYGGAITEKDSGNYIAVFAEVRTNNFDTHNRSDSTGNHDNGNLFGCWGDLT